MMRLTASRTRTSDDIKASDHTTRAATAPGFGAPGNDETYGRSRRLGACEASNPITTSSVRLTVRSWDLAQAARSPGCAAGPPSPPTPIIGPEVIEPEANEPAAAAPATPEPAATSERAATSASNDDPDAAATSNPDVAATSKPGMPATATTMAAAGSDVNQTGQGASQISRPRAIRIPTTLIVPHRSGKQASQKNSYHQHSAR